ALQKEGVAIGDCRELLLQLACFTCKDQRRIGRKLTLRLGERRSVRKCRNLADRLASPRTGGPFSSHVCIPYRNRACRARASPVLISGRGPNTPDVGCLPPLAGARVSGRVHGFVRGMRAGTS